MPRDILFMVWLLSRILNISKNSQIDLQFCTPEKASKQCKI